ncbi:hypothetical protein [Anaeromyxobacter terrae]|uniref:hypothetical protein n=1 Tax=Anaeromyxobacter terrae TaxID=2925406 RepID=UPI001F592FAD|nr:hypothetical protein [Anaeromyxobacter sp. SG22]
MKHQVITVALSLAFVGLALAAGQYRRAALIGATTCTFTALGSMLVLSRSVRNAEKPLKPALLVMTVAFLARILLVALGTVFVARAGENVFAFVVAFFVPYFAFSAVEGAYLHSLRRYTGRAA